MQKAEMSLIIIGKLMNISGILQRESNRLLLPHGLNQQQFSVLFEIAKAGEVQQKDMVNRLLLEKAHMSKIVKKLQEMGLVTARPISEDKRSFMLSPTDRGLETIEKCRILFEEWRKNALDRYSKKELSVILESVDMLQIAFKDVVS